MENKTLSSIKDVARAANCSTATVSRVLNGTGRVGSATRKRVLEVCKKCGYTPHSAGRNLRSRKTEMIGVLVYPSCSEVFSDVFYSEILGGIEEELSRENYHLLLAGCDLSTMQDELPRFLREGRVDGVILTGCCPDELKQKVVEARTPVLLLDQDLSGSRVDSVTSDGFRAMMDMTSYLHSKGHRRMVLFRHKFDNYNENFRSMGFEAEVRRLGLEKTSEVIAVDTGEEAADEIARRIEVKNPVTAVLGIADDMAASILVELQKIGIEVPRQVSVTGFDDSSFSRMAHPPLTTIQVDRNAMGVEAAKTILRRLNQPDAPPCKLTVPSKLIKRRSVRAL